MRLGSGYSPISWPEEEEEEKLGTRLGSSIQLPYTCPTMLIPLVILAAILILRLTSLTSHSMFISHLISVPTVGH